MLLQLLKSNRLSTRLALSLTGFGLGYVLLLMAIFMLVDLPAAKRDIDKEINRVIDTFIDPATQSVFNLDEETARTVLAGFERYAYVEKATIKTEDQVTLAEKVFIRETTQDRHFLLAFFDSQRTKSYYRQLSDDRFNDGVHGSLLIDVNQYRAMQGVVQRMQSVLYANLFQYFIFVVIVYGIVYRLVTRRVAGIHAALEAISPKSPEGRRVPVGKISDELSDLAVGMNTFIDTAENYLQAKNEAERGLLYLTQHLEEVILERTADLEQAKQNAEKARDEANQANQAKSVFLSNMSHELRTPLNSILGFTQRILKTGGAHLSHRENDALQRVFDNGKYLLNLVNDILDIAKIEANKMELDICSVTLNTLVSECCRQMESLADSKKLEVINQVTEPVVIEGDFQKLQQVLINLISNGIKYTEQGKLTISLDNTGADEIVLHIEDTGVGIATSDFAKIFDPYNHIHSDLNQAVSVQSTGLGLPLSRKIVQLHQGDIEVTSKQGTGSCFSIRLPRKLGNRAAVSVANMN